MNEQRDIDLLNDMLAYQAELSWLEFKKDNSDKQVIGKLCSALSNGARLAERDFGYVVWGVDDSTYKILGTTFDPDTVKVSNQGLAIWLTQQLKPSVAFDFKIIHHPQGRIVLLEIPAATTAPVAFNDIPYIRIGSATPKLFDHPNHYARLIESLRPYTWEQGIAKQYVTAAYSHLT